MQCTCLICKVQVTLIWPYVIIFLISKDSLGWHCRPNNMPRLANFLHPLAGQGLHFMPTIIYSSSEDCISKLSQLPHG